MHKIACMGEESNGHVFKYLEIALRGCLRSLLMFESAQTLRKRHNGKETSEVDKNGLAIFMCVLVLICFQVVAWGNEMIILYTGVLLNQCFILVFLS